MMGVVPKAIALALVRFYQTCISPWLPDSCRFHPSCSEYGRQAIERFGALRGSWLTLRRICKCHPFHPGGCDPVPPTRDCHNNEQP